MLKIISPAARPKPFGHLTPAKITVAKINHPLRSRILALA